MRPTKRHKWPIKTQFFHPFWGTSLMFSSTPCETVKPLLFTRQRAKLVKLARIFHWKNDSTYMHMHVKLLQPQSAKMDTKFSHSYMKHVQHSFTHTQPRDIHKQQHKQPLKSHISWKSFVGPTFPSIFPPKTPQEIRPAPYSLPAFMKPTIHPWNFPLISPASSA